MNAELKIELSPEQQKLLLRGLKFVRSSVALEMRDFTEEFDAKRKQQYQELDTLESLLMGAGSHSTATV